MTIKNKDNGTYYDIRKVFYRIEEYSIDNGLDKGYEETNIKLLDDTNNNIYYNLYDIYKSHKDKMVDNYFTTKEFIFSEELIYLELIMKYEMLNNETMKHIEQSFPRLKFEYLHYETIY